MLRPLLLLASAGLLLPADPPEVSFDREVRPILSQHCFRCHGPDAGSRKAKLRLDTRAGVFADAQGRALVVPGKPDQSLILQRITHADPKERMPPTSAHSQPSAAEIATLRRWIEEGAGWEEHWAFRAPGPAAADQSIDDFVAERLQRAGLRPAPAADRRTWLRRVTLDLTGLPPTPAEIAAFVADEASGAFARVVDRLLASPRYGERMAWDWLDAARYADTNGFQHDRTRTMWPYRDWVVQALNDNLPFDQFLTWQLAGDLLPGASRAQRLATAFLRNHMINGEGGRIPEENRVEYVFDQLETVGTVFLGLTLNCCRCHDHKFDPISQREYYALSAYFNQTPVDGKGISGHVPPVLTMPSGNPRKPHKVMVMQDREGAPRKTYVLERGLYNQRRGEVEAGTPAVLPPLPADAPPNRLALARWLTRPDHPLTARVLVNRDWQMFFGRGLVKTVGDFGVQGDKPSHPALLDWLSRDFVDHGWDRKRLHRQIALSRTYRQTAAVGPEAYARDPDNTLLGRGPRHRLPAWMLRDLALASSGLLVETRGGPAVKPYQPAGLWAEATFGTQRYRRDSGDKLYRRSLYTFWRRIISPPMFFDNASRQTCEVQARLTNTPLHALATLNDTTYVEAARALAVRLLLEAKNDRARLERAFLLTLSRTPEQQESELLGRRLRLLRSDFAADPAAARKLLAVGEHVPRLPFPVAELAAWQSLCSLIFNLDEALSR